MLPKVIIYNAVSMDGDINFGSVDMGTYYGLVQVWKEDATLSGSETILKGEGDVPAERQEDFKPWKVDPNDKRALLVIPDSRGRIRIWNYLRRSGYWRDVMALCSRSTPVRYLEYLRRRHIDCIIAGEKKVDLKAALETLRDEFGIRTVRSDSGGVLNGVLLRLGLVDELSILIHPNLAGDAAPKHFYHGPALPPESCKLKLFRMERIRGGLVWLRYRVVH
jgi:2,5-diamino-6-(ribosylamino)-4(3H)-pyrimidinone 5'-phosphate reductase